MNEYDPKTHTYKIDGRIVPSVTQALKESGIIDTTPYSMEAAIRGTTIHEACQFLDENDLDEKSVDPSIVPYVSAYQKFLKDKKPRIISIEQAVYNKSYFYAGTLDRIVSMNDDLFVIDIKTGQPANWWPLQLSGYSLCLSEPHRRACLQLKNDGTYKMHFYTDLLDKNVFLSCVAVANWKRNH